MSAAIPSYFFWIDDVPTAQFQHEVRFVLVNGELTGTAPTVANGGILVSQQGWWPVVTPFGGSPQEFFRLLFDVATDNPPGYANPEGLIAGPAISPSDIIILPEAASAPAGPADANKACALLVAGDARSDFTNDLKIWEFQDSHPPAPTNDMTENPPDVYGFGHRAYIEHVVDALKNGTPALVDGLEGRKSLELISAIYESVETGKQVPLRFRSKRSHSRLGI